MLRPYVRLLLAVSFALGGSACDETTSTNPTADVKAEVAGPDAGADVAGDVAAIDPGPASPDTPTTDANEGPWLTVVVQGTLEDKAPDDGLGEQTPDPYIYGLQSLELLRTPDDPEPFVVFDHSPGFVACDMHGRTEVAKVPVAGFPLETFHYFRFSLTHVEADLDATIHGIPNVGSAATKLHVVYGLSDVSAQGLELAQGDTIISGELYGTPFETTSFVEPVYAEPAPGAWAENKDGKTWITCTANPPLETDPSAPVDMSYATRYYIKDSFRWQDEDKPGYAAGVWDMEVGPPASAEQIIRMGANFYETVQE